MVDTCDILCQEDFLPGHELISYSLLLFGLLAMLNECNLVGVTDVLVLNGWSRLVIFCVRKTSYLDMS